MVFCVGIGGATRSGKSTLTRNLEAHYNSNGYRVVVVHLDHFLCGGESPNAVRWREFTAAIAKAKRSSSSSSTRTTKSSAAANDDDRLIVLVEGFLVFAHQPLLDSGTFDAKLFLRVSRDEIYERRKRTKRTGLAGASFDRVFDNEIYANFQRFGDAEVLLRDDPDLVVIDADGNRTPEQVADAAVGALAGLSSSARTRATAAAAAAAAAAAESVLVEHGAAAEAGGGARAENDADVDAAAAKHVAISILSAQIYLTLSTCGVDGPRSSSGDGAQAPQPWCTPLSFWCGAPGGGGGGGGGLVFYFASSPASRHVQQLSINPAAAVSMFDSAAPFMTGSGLQFAARARIFSPSDASFQPAVACISIRFPREPAAECAARHVTLFSRLGYCVVELAVAEPMFVSIRDGRHEVNLTFDELCFASFAS